MVIIWETMMQMMGTMMEEIDYILHKCRIFELSFTIQFLHIFLKNMRDDIGNQWFFSNQICFCSEQDLYSFSDSTGSTG
ncbi:MAG: hypothetical protein PWQ49_1093 [Methanohalophilus sp.]|nr:hypothetical protein [Methanohalophilus sp.]